MDIWRMIGRPFAFALVCALGVPSCVFVPLVLVVASSHGVVDGWGWFALWCYGGAGILSVPFALAAWPFVAVHGTLSDRHLTYAATASAVLAPFAFRAYRPVGGHPALVDLMWAHGAALVCAFLGGTVAISMARWLGILPRRRLPKG